MSTEAMNEIIGTIKRLDESQKQTINNWVRKTHDKANIAIWAVKAEEEERVDLNRRLADAISSGDWSPFDVGPADGQVAAAPKVAQHEPDVEVKLEPEPEVSEEDIAEASKAIDKAVDESANSHEPEPDWPDNGFTRQIKKLINDEVERRLTVARRKVLNEVIAEFNGLAKELGN